MGTLVEPLYPGKYVRVHVYSAAQSYLTPCDPIDCGPQGFSVQGLPRQDYWSRLPSPTPADLLNPGTEPTFPALAGRFFTTEPAGRPMYPGTPEAKPQPYIVSSSACVCSQSLSRVRLFMTPQTVARQAPLSMGFSRQEYWR